MRDFIKVLVIGMVGGFCGAYVFSRFSVEFEDGGVMAISHLEDSVRGFMPILTSSFDASRTIAVPNEDFVEASRKSTPSVVFIQTLSEYEYRSGGWMDWFFEPRRSQRVGSGSGVIFSKDGYIITNYHVIDGADEITVIAGKRSYSAELIGVDPSSDLAVIKVASHALPQIELGNSDDISVGEWVLAVGNPFNLTSTVTAGIVSAKGRNINLLREKFPIESFIQTDAAINPGNSGGALVNADGKLVGINTAILSRTGSYAGYGFAIPVNIVSKVFKDIVKYGEVQKAFVGAEFIDIDSDIARRLEIAHLDGIIVSDILPNGAADKAGLRKGDVVRRVNGQQIMGKANFEEFIANSYPGDQLDILIERNNKLSSKKLILTNKEGTTGIVKRNVYTSSALGVTFEGVSKVEKNLLGIQNGVKVVDFKKTGFFAELSIPKGFIIIQVNNRIIEDPEALAEILETIRGRFDIIGLDNRGRKVYYPFRR